MYDCSSQEHKIWKSINEIHTIFLYLCTWCTTVLWLYNRATETQSYNQCHGPTVGELNLSSCLCVPLSLTHTHASISIVYLRKQICLIQAVVPQPQLQPCRAFVWSKALNSDLPSHQLNHFAAEAPWPLSESSRLQQQHGLSNLQRAWAYFWVCTRRCN